MQHAVQKKTLSKEKQLLWNISKGNKRIFLSTGLKDRII